MSEKLLNLDQDATLVEKSDRQRHLTNIGMGLNVVFHTFKITERQVSERLGISQQEVRSLENGQFDDYARLEDILIKVREWLIELDTQARIRNL